MVATYTFFFFIKLKKIFNVALKGNIFHIFIFHILLANLNVRQAQLSSFRVRFTALTNRWQH